MTMITRIRRFWRSIVNPASRPLSDCSMGEWCDGRSARHGRCAECSAISCRRSAWIDPDTLRRRMPFLCEAHSYGDTRMQHELRQRRRLNDLERITDPPRTFHIVPDRMPDQYAGPTRDAIRHMLASDEEQVVVLGIDAASLNASLQSVGLTNRMYAETRDGETVLRKVAS